MTAPLRIRFAVPNFKGIADEYRKLPKSLSAITQGAALKRAMQPAFSALKGQVSGGNVKVGPTGNLRRSVKLITKRYPNTGTGVCVVGFQKAGTGKSKSAGGGKVKKGSDRAFHQFWLEFGTKERHVSKQATTPYVRRNRTTFKAMKKALGKKQAEELSEKTQKVKRQGGYIASSFASLGPFRLKASKGGTGRVGTTPGYPKAFFRKSTTPINLGSMRPFQPVRRAWMQSKDAVAGSMEKELRVGILNAYKQMADHARKRAEALAKAEAGFPF
jgi:hypothetical protein